MRYHYLKVFALIVGGSVPVLAQNLPATIRTRPHGWYMSATAAAMQPQGFATNSSILQNGASAVQSAWGMRLGYSHSPTLALETGLVYLHFSSGFQLQAEQVGMSRPYLRSSFYVPATLVARLWEPAPRLAVKALMGGGMYLRTPEGFGSFIDTVGYQAGSKTVPNQRVFVTKQGTSRNIRYVAELGLRAEWQASPRVFIGADVKDIISLSGVEDDVISVSDEAASSVLATAHMTSRLQTLSVGVNIRYVFQAGTAYQYRPLP